MSPVKALLSVVIAALVAPADAAEEPPVRNPFDRASAVTVRARVLVPVASSPSKQGSPATATAASGITQATLKTSVSRVGASPASAASAVGPSLASKTETKRLACDGVRLPMDAWSAKAVGDVMKARLTGAGGIACVSALGVDQEWVSLTRLNGSSEVEVSVEPNAFGKPRQALVHIVTPARTLTLRVRQAGGESTQVDAPVAIR